RAGIGLGRGVAAGDQVRPRQGGAVEVGVLTIAVGIRRTGDADLERRGVVRRHAVPVDALGHVQRTELAGVGDDRREFGVAAVTRNRDGRRRAAANGPTRAGARLGRGVVTRDEAGPGQRAAVEADGLAVAVGIRRTGDADLERLV